MAGYIKLFRDIQSHWIYEEKRKFSRYEAWLDLLMMVNHSDGKTMQDGELIDVKRGERITSIRILMNRWDWSNTKVVKFLEVLKKDEMISYEITPKKKTLIKIEKYDKWQGFDGKEEVEEKTQKRQEKDSETTQNNINKNDKEEVKRNKNKDYMSEIKEFLVRYQSIEGFNQLNKDYWDVIRKTRKSGKVAESVIHKSMEKWNKYDPIVVQYALKTHIEVEDGERAESYTLGIMRRTSLETAKDKLDRKVVQFTKKQSVDTKSIFDEFKNMEG